MITIRTWTATILPFLFGGIKFLTLNYQTDMRFLGFLLVSFLFLSVSPIEEKSKEFNLTVKVTGIVGTKGSIEVGLFDEPS